MLYRGFCRGRKQKVLLVERNRKVSQRAFVKVDNYRKATLCNVGEHLKGCYVVDLIAEQSRQSFLSLCVCVCVCARAVGFVSIDHSEPLVVRVCVCVCAVGWWGEEKQNLIHSPL